MRYEKLFISITTICYAFYIFSYPPSFYNDDSLFLAQGIDFFSVIDFSPHFPGYPALIIFGKTINIFVEDSKLTLFILTASSAILIPTVIYFLVKKIVNYEAALVAYIISLTSPYLINLSLTMLSDSMGLFFFLLGLYCLQVNEDKKAGFIFAIALFSRPSYLILFVVGFIYLLFYKKESVKNILIFFCFGIVFFLGFIFINEGFLYIIEAKRFIIGHFNLWGTGQNSEINWFENIFQFSNIPYALLIYCIFKINYSLKLYYALFIFYLLWILLAQNPDNIRHIIPLILLSNILIASALYSYKYIIIPLFLIFNLLTISNFSQNYSPIENIAKDLKNEDKMIITNRGIEILRVLQPNTVIDKYYSHSTNYLQTHNQTITISTLKPKNKKE